MSNQADKQPDKPATTPRQALNRWVNARANTLIGIHTDKDDEDGYLDDNPASVRAIAMLARSAEHEVGKDPEIFQWTIPDIDETDIYPHGVGNDGGPTAQEEAAHTAMTLFAIHQQSKREQAMHTDERISLGRAVGELAFRNSEEARNEYPYHNEKGIRAMFDSLQTASSWKETRRHARRLIRLLKREDLPLNYGLLASDLLALRGTRQQANSVRLQWGRDYQNGYGIARKRYQDKIGSKGSSATAA